MTATGPPTRIVVALDVARDNLNALEIAAALAARRRVELTALFVEDINLIHLAGLPFAREVGRVSGRERPLDAPIMGRSLRAQAEQARRLLTQVTGTIKLQASLQIVRGHYVKAALSACSEMDILLLSGGRKSAPYQPRPGASRPEPVWIVYRGDAGSDRALSLASEIALAGDTGLVVALAGSDPAQNLQNQSETVLGTWHPPTRYLSLPAPASGQLEPLIRREGCGLVILDRQYAQQAGAALLDVFRCPVVLSA